VVDFTAAADFMAVGMEDADNYPHASHLQQERVVRRGWTALSPPQVEFEREVLSSIFA
jgi:hypothetical protein